MYQTGDYNRAVQYLNAAVQVDPSNWQAYQVLGTVYYKTNDHQAALTAFDKSLAIHSDNPSLKSFADQIRASLALPPPVTSATAPPPGSGNTSSPTVKTPKETITVFGEGRWVNVRLAPIFATLGDLQTGADTVTKNQAVNLGTATNGNLGVLLGVEAGYSFDSHNAISLSADLGLFDGYKDQYSQGFYSGLDSFSPTMGAVEVKYSRFFNFGSNRLRVGAGPGLYITSLQVTQAVNNNVIVTGPMNGFGFGGSLNLSFEIYLARDFMLSIFGEGRIASTSNIQGQFVDPNGNIQQVGLVMDKNNYLGTAATTYIGTNGLRWATVDYTGGDAGLGLSVRY